MAFVNSGDTTILEKSCKITLETVKVWSSGKELPKVDGGENNENGYHSNQSPASPSFKDLRFNKKP